MTNNDDLWMKLEAAESDELALNGNEVSNQLRHLADNEIDSDLFAVVSENYNGSEVEFERPITDLAIDAAEVIDALLAERDAKDKRIEMLEGANASQDDHINQQQNRIDALEQRNSELGKYAGKLEAISAAAEKLVRCKGRYHSEQNYRALAALFGVTTPDLPPLEHENVHYADAAEMEIATLRQLIAELEARTVSVKLPEPATEGGRGYRQKVIWVLREALFDAGITLVVGGE